MLPAVVRQHIIRGHAWKSCTLQGRQDVEEQEAARGIPQSPVVHFGKDLMS